MDAAEFCLAFDRQLDLAGALPLKAAMRSPLHRAQSSAVV
jgi:hypothetical protein